MSAQSQPKAVKATVTRALAQAGGVRPISHSSSMFTPAEPLLPPSAEVTKAENDMVTRNLSLPLSDLSLSESQLPLRPGYGTKGEQIVLRTNYFHIIPEPELLFYRYNVEINPKLIGARKRKRAFRLLLDKAPFLDVVRPAVATDYRTMLVTTKQLDLGPDNRTTTSLAYYDVEEGVPDTATALSYAFSISSSNTFKTQELLDYLSYAEEFTKYAEKESVLQALNIVMADRPSRDLDVAVAPRANRFFPTNAFLADLGGGLIALRGYYTSVCTAPLRLLLNANTVTATFYRPGPLLDLMRDFRKCSNDRWRESLNMFLHGLRVEVIHIKTKMGLSKIRTIMGLARSPIMAATAKEASFYWQEKGSTLTVEDYFKQKYQISLEKPQAPLVNIGNAGKTVLIPAELCIVLPGQRNTKWELTPEQSQNMIKVACRKPAANAELIISEGAHVMGIGPGSPNGPAQFGLQITAQMLTVEGRILSPPSVAYRAKTISPVSGSWNMRFQKFSVGAHVEKWTFLKVQMGEVDQTDDILPGLIEEFKTAMEKCGLRVKAPKSPTKGLVLKLDLLRPNTHDAAIDQCFSDICKTNTTKMLLIVLPNKNQALYSRLKYFGDVRYGLMTHCCVVSSKLKAGPGRSQLLANWAMKWNLMAGGINQRIPAENMGILSTAKTMVVGIDVTHPSALSLQGSPSVAGVVASFDAKCGQFPASVRCQESRKEMVTELEDMVVERLEVWQKHNANTLPENVLVYRDGVSDGQLLTVLTQESAAFDMAFAKVYPSDDLKPKLTIVIVGKRHHTRFYPTKQEDADGSGNPKNGTIVDRGITSEKFWDFYLQAHTGIQGTARPAHYTVVKDQIGFNADDLEQLTHNLCYLYGRATKAVSVCPPAYYADLLCERARCYLHDTYIHDATSSIAATFDMNTARWIRDVHPDLAETMFYI